jgi:uncharacterized lipoprotein YmbA
MNLRAANFFLAVVGAATLAACASTPPSRFYTLSAPPTPASPAGSVSVSVGPVTIPAVVDRPEIVVTISDHEVWLDEFNRWASPLGEAIALAVAENLAVQLDSTQMSLSSAGLPAEYRVGVEVQRFESVPGSYALLDAVFIVRRGSGAQTANGRTTAREPALERGYDAIAAAHSRAVSRLGRDIGAVIRKLEEACARGHPDRAQGSPGRPC